jgi:DNA-directed RNA polymerase subunit RPC12/RpoP
MPIRFRCAYCNQLMGISRRKAGTVVRCPKCAGEIIVPAPDGAAGPEDAAEQAGGQAFDVEKLDFGVEPVNGSVGATAVTPGAPAPPESLAPPTSVPPPPQRVGVFVPLGMLIISIGVVVLLLILMFIIGLIIGRATVLPAEIKNAANARFSPAALESPTAAPDPARNSCPA